MMPPRLPGPAHFAGRNALVTGGTEGLGRDLVRALVGLGATVHFCGRERRQGEDLAKELGPGARFYRLDLAKVDETRDFVRTAAGRSRTLDFVVNNAAMDPRIEFRRARVADFDRIVAVNLRAYFVVAHAALPALRRGRGKAILNLSTTNYMLGLAPFTLYNASKAGILGFTRSLARELGADGIRVNAIAPGWVMTERQLNERVKAGDRERLLEDQALKFLLNEAHVTPASLFLLSPAAAAITGQTLVVDGGKCMQ